MMYYASGRVAAHIRSIGRLDIFKSEQREAPQPRGLSFASNLGEVQHAHTNLAGFCVCPVLHRCNLEPSTALALVWSSRSCGAGVLGSLRVAGRPPSDLDSFSSYSRSMHRWHRSAVEMRAMGLPQPQMRCWGNLVGSQAMPLTIVPLCSSFLDCMAYSSAAIAVSISSISLDRETRRSVRMIRRVCRWFTAITTCRLRFAGAGVSSSSLVTSSLSWVRASWLARACTGRLRSAV